MNRVPYLHPAVLLLGVLPLLSGCDFGFVFDELDRVAVAGGGCYDCYRVDEIIYEETVEEVWDDPWYYGDTVYYDDPYYYEDEVYFVEEYDEPYYYEEPYYEEDYYYEDEVYVGESYEAVEEAWDWDVLWW